MNHVLWCMREVDVFFPFIVALVLIIYLISLVSHHYIMHIYDIFINKKINIIMSKIYNTEDMQLKEYYRIYPLGTVSKFIRILPNTLKMTFKKFFEALISDILS